MLQDKIMAREYLIQCQAKNNTFQCSLTKEFRDVECKKSDLSLRYANTTIFSPNLG